jgi:phosphoribosylaminoimidazole-succinocarboxamide synthase
MVLQKSLITKEFPGQTDMYEGKVRIVRTVGNVLVVETSDDISAFDRVLPRKIPNKGTILNLMAAHFMNATKDIIPNCLLSVPHPRMAIWRKTTPFKFEVVVRAYMEGSMWRDQYSKGQRELWGYTLPEGIGYQQKLPELMFTPSTKAQDGKHDEPITKEEILAQGLATLEEYEYIRKKAFELFQRGEEMAQARGLILVDTKYEFGKDKNGIIYLIDEIHTPDSSRYYYLEGYKEKFSKGEPQKQLSKEFVRQWLIDQGYQGKDGQQMPEFTDDFVQQTSGRYLELYEQMVGSIKKTVGPDDMNTLSDAGIIYEKTLAELVKIRPQVEGPAVSIVMGSNSDLPMIQPAINVLIQAGVPFECGAVSAHRTPADVEIFAKKARSRGVKAIIAAAGGAAHLPGMIAASTTLPVIGIPVKSAKSMMDGLDSLLSIVQMPAGVPVGTMAVDGAENAGLYALQILATTDARLASYLEKHKQGLLDKVAAMRVETGTKYYLGGI